MPPCTEPLSSAGTSLWRHRDFRRYLTGQAASVAGSSITQMALPVLAVLHLDASTAQVAWLMFLGQLPPALFALHAGALADRSLLCNGIVAFGDTGAVLPDGQIQEPRRAGRTAA